MALKSLDDDDVVTFGLDMTPNTAVAATLINWFGATPAQDNLTATLPANTEAGPIEVFASGCSAEPTTDPLESWIMWGQISYNFGSVFDTDDKLTFAGANPAIPGSVITASPVAAYNGEGYYCARIKMEIMGVLQPFGVGAIVGDAAFTFNYQTVSSYFWQITPSPTDNHSSIGPAANDYPPGFATGFSQQIVPRNDKLFAIDAPGLTLAAGFSGYGGLAANFQNCIYIGTVPASDQTTWHAFIQPHFKGNSIELIVYPNYGVGNPDLPTTWTDSAWNGEL